MRLKERTVVVQPGETGHIGRRHARARALFQRLGQSTAIPASERQDCKQSETKRIHGKSTAS